MAVNYIHEKQIRQLCCVHAVNNLLQIDAYSACPLASKHEFDQLADELTKQEKALMLSEDSTTISLTLWDKLFSRHRTILLGNYSYEVLEKALERRKITLSWMRDISFTSVTSNYEALLKTFRETNLVGFILNTKIVDESLLKRLVLPSDRRHWISLTRFSTQHSVNSDTCLFRLLDSNLDSCVEIDNWISLMNFLKKRVDCGDKIFLASAEK